MKVKHLSFDLWNTLIRSNPLFKKERISLIRSKYNPLGKTLSEIKEIVDSVDVMCDQVISVTGNHIPALNMYAMILHQVGYYAEEVDVKILKNECDKLFLNYPPFPYDDDTINVMEELRFDHGYTMSILSNTGFIEGSVVQMALEQLGMDRFFGPYIFSDQIGFSKPHKQAFDEMFEEVNRWYEYQDFGQVSHEEIMHIGDNYRADIMGAVGARMQAFQINSKTSQTPNIKALLSHENLLLTQDQ